MQKNSLEQRRLNRRSVLGYALGSAAVASLSPLLNAQSGPTALSERISLITAGGANVIAAATGDGLVLVDSGPAAVTDSLLDSLDGLGAGDVHSVFNTHWHPEQVGGNEAFGRMGASIIAHQKTHERLSIPYYLPQEARYHQPLPATAWPTQVFHDQGTITTGDTNIDYGWLVQPHTDGDIYVHFREANILAVGDALAPDRDPVLDWFGGGWLGGRVNSLDHLLGIANDETLIVPAYGSTLDRAGLQAERDLMQEVYNRVLDLIRSGCSATCMAQEGALDGLGRTWQDPERFLYDAYKGMWAHHYNLAPNIL